MSGLPAAAQKWFAAQMQKQSSGQSQSRPLMPLHCSNNFRVEVAMIRGESGNSVQRCQGPKRHNVGGFAFGQKKEKRGADQGRIPHTAAHQGQKNKISPSAAMQWVAMYMEQKRSGAQRRKCATYGVKTI